MDAQIRIIQIKKTYILAEIFSFDDQRNAGKDTLAENFEVTL